MTLKTRILILILIFLILSAIIGCNTSNKEGCTDDPECISKVENQLYELGDRVTTIEVLIEGLEYRAETSINLLNNSVSNLETSQDNTIIHYNNQQSQITSLVVQLTILNGYNHVAGLIDPCGDGPGYDEIIIRLSDSSLVAYFETGHTRFLSSLQPGVYRTTDKQQCIFAVGPQMGVTW